MAFCPFWRPMAIGKGSATPDYPQSLASYIRVRIKHRPVQRPWTRDTTPPWVQIKHRPVQRPWTRDTHPPPPTVPRNYSELPPCHHIGKRWSKDHGPYALYLQTVDYKAHIVPGRQTTLQVMLLKIQQLFVAIQRSNCASVLQATGV